MLTFDEARYVGIQSGAVSLAKEIRTTIFECLDAGAKNVFFLGTGGAAILMGPAAQMLQRRSNFPTFYDVGAELNLSGSVHLNSDSIVVLPSLSGTTLETLETLAFAQSRRAKVIGLVGNKQTPLGLGSAHAFINSAEDDTSSESFYIQSLLIALSIMSYRNEISNFSEIVSELAFLPKILVELKKSFDGEAERIAGLIAERPYHMITGAGGTWFQAFYYGMCILEEMQWIRTRPVHASDFFHGSLELIEKDVSLIILKGDDVYRPLVERVQKFSSNYTKQLTVIDTADFALPNVSIEVRALISPILLAAALERVSAHLELKRNHPLTTRRYYKKVQY